MIQGVALRKEGELTSAKLCEFLWGKGSKVAPRREIQAQARADSLDRGRENHTCAMLIDSARQAAFRAKEKKNEKKSSKKGGYKP